jgi:hypothetical protein
MNVWLNVYLEISVKNCACFKVVIIFVISYVVLCAVLVTVLLSVDRKENVA